MADILERAGGVKWEQQAMSQPTGKTDGSKSGSSWLGRYIAGTSGFWKAAVCFQIAFLALMLLHAGALLAGWHNVSNRMLGYSSLAFVGFFVSLLRHACVSIRESMKQNAEKKQNETR